jgi:parallel beta-helix repeat protein
MVEYIPPLGGPPRRSATIIVAANDSKDKTSADYVCDGVNDQVEINAAINDLPTFGGRVILLEGNYNISSSIQILKNYVTLEGQGEGTILFLTNNANVRVIQVGNGTTSFEGITIKNLKINGNKANQTTSVDGIYFYGTLTYTIKKSSVINCRIENCKRNGITFTSVEDSLVAYNQLNNNGVDGLEVGGGIRNRVIGNYISFNGTKGIDLGDFDDVISGNIIYNNGASGIYIEGGDRNTIIGNILRNNTYDGIEIYDGSYCIIIGNRCFQNSRYGINISSSSASYNLVVKNYLTGNTTGSFRDAGTGTIKAASTTNDNVV